MLRRPRHVRRRLARPCGDLAAALERYGAQRPHPVSIQRWTRDFAEPRRLAQFLCSEMPIRYAERLRCIEGVKGWRELQELTELHRIQLMAFQAFASRPPWEDVEAFKGLVQQVQSEDRVTKLLLMQAAQRLSLPEPELNKFLDDFLLSRLGCNMLMGQWMATTSAQSIVTSCDAHEICRKAVDEVRRRCLAAQGRAPIVTLRAFTMKGQVVTEGVPRFSYIAGILMHVVRELLKNSCQATLELAHQEEELLSMPIELIVCADYRHVVIQLTDRARGIPRHVGKRVWSYLYSGSPTAMTGLSFGYGIGLPLSRLHARYLGGSLDLVSLPGYGVDAYLSLPRVDAELVETVPDEAAEVSQQINLLTL